MGSPGHMHKPWFTSSRITRRDVPKGPFPTPSQSCSRHRTCGDESHLFRLGGNSLPVHRAPARTDGAQYSRGAEARSWRGFPIATIVNAPETITPRHETISDSGETIPKHTPPKTPPIEAAASSFVGGGR